ncbi:MAG: single-stranded DNA-binding protein [Bacilli bacterium]|nr:single-stranded DNA-binding protein [Bacilli bacterium]
MLNQIVLVGRLVKDPEIIESEDGKKRAYVTLAIPRSFKNADGEYESDFINCTLWDAIAKSTTDYCKKGDIVGVKGRVQSSTLEKEDGEKQFRIDVIAERVTFLTSKKEKEQSGKEK